MADVTQTTQYRLSYLLRFERLWARCPEKDFPSVWLEAARACVLARLEGRPAPSGIETPCDRAQTDEKLLEIIAWYLEQKETVG